VLSAWDLLIEIYSQKIKTTACLLLEIVLDFILQNTTVVVRYTIPSLNNNIVK
jgi:hypothetical protein